MHTVEEILNQSSTNLSSNFVMLVAYNIFLSQITEEFINVRSVGVYQRNKSLTVAVTLNHAPCLLWPPYGIGQAIIFLPCGFFLLLLMAALRSRCGHYVLPCGFFLSICLFYSSPNLSHRRLDVYHTSTHDVALVRI